MNFKNYNIYFFFLLLIGVSTLAFFLFKPFFVPFLLAAILAKLFYPFYRWLLKVTGDKRGISSIITCLVVALVIVIPLAAISAMAVDEVVQMLDKVSRDRSDLKYSVMSLIQTVSYLPFFEGIEINKFINQETILSAIKNISQTMLGLIQSAYRGTVHFLFMTFIMFFSLFYLLIDGKQIISKLVKLSPLKDSYEKMLIEKFNSIVQATLKGTILIALIQGFIVAVLFGATGVSSPVLLGLITVIVSVIPVIGPFLVWLPTGIIMIFIGNYFEGVIILLVGALVISMIDNLLRPKLVSGDTKMHPLIVLFSTLGGLSLFGISGFLVGPIVAALFIALWNIYYLEFKEQLEKFNAC